MKPTKEPPQTPSAMRKSGTAPAPPPPAQQLKQLLEGVASGRYKRVIVMAGAGISTAAGIPDFRSPKTGLYDNLQRLNLPYPEAVFDIAYLRKRPEAFFMLAEEMYPTQFQPTTFHRLMKWISDRGALKRVYTQNIDTLERIAGVPGDKIVEAHGSFAAVHCIDCGKEADKDAVERLILAKTGQIPRCASCNGIVKPDIVFFGEALPQRFFELQEEDFEDVDLAIVAGSSLQVSPFNQLPDLVPLGVPRVLLNLDRVGTFGRRKHDDLLVLGKLEELDPLFESFIGASDSTPHRDSGAAAHKIAEDIAQRHPESVAEPEQSGTDNDEAKATREVEKAEPDEAKRQPLEDLKGSGAPRKSDTSERPSARESDRDHAPRQPQHEPREPVGDKPTEEQVSAVADLLTRLGLSKK